MKKLTSSLIILAFIGLPLSFTGCQSQPKAKTAPQQTSKVSQSTTVAVSTTSKTTKAPHSSSNSQYSTAVQCRGYTKEGKRCQRKTIDPSGYCWQHK